MSARLIHHCNLHEATQGTPGHISPTLHASEGYVMWHEKACIVVTRPSHDAWAHKTVCIPLSNVKSFSFDDTPPAEAQ